MKIQRILLATLFLFSCHSEEKNQVIYIKQVKSRAMQKPIPLPQIKTVEKFYYKKVDNLANPFREREAKACKVKNLSSDFLNFVGVLKIKNKTWGLIHRNDGVVFPIKIGDALGEKKVISINDKLLQIEESRLVGGQLKKEIKAIYLTTREVEKNN